MSIALFHNVDRKQQLFIDSQKKELIAVKNAEYSLSGRQMQASAEENRL